MCIKIPPPPKKNPSEKAVHWLLLLKVKVLLASPTSSLCFPAVRMTMMHSDFSSCSKLKAKHCNEDFFNPHYITPVKTITSNRQ